MATLTGDEILYVQGIAENGMPAATQFVTTTGDIAALAESFDSTQQIITALNTVGAGTITAAGIVGGITLRGGSQSATPFTDTTATAALIIAALPSWAQVGMSFEYTYLNNTDAIATITGGSGVTVTINTTVKPNMAATFLVTYASASTFTMVGIGTETYNPTGVTSLTTLNTTGAGSNIFNTSSLDADFTVKKLTSGNAISYDAGTDALLVNGTTVGITGAITATGAFTQTTGAVIINNGATDNDFTAKKLTSGNWLLYDAGTDALTLNGATIGLTGATTQTGNFTQTGAGAVVFNNSAADTDFTVKALTSGNAISYDAGTSAIALAATTIGLTGAITHTGAVSQSGSTTYTTATSTTILKQGANGKTGTVILNGLTPVSVSNSSITANSGVFFTLKTVGGTVSISAPNIITITPGVGFTVAGLVSDTSTYNYHVLESAA